MQPRPFSVNEGLALSAVQAELMQAGRNEYADHSVLYR